jgi:hypothetical protein
MTKRSNRRWLIIKGNGGKHDNWKELKTSSTTEITQEVARNTENIGIKLLRNTIRVAKEKFDRKLQGRIGAEDT